MTDQSNTRNQEPMWPTLAALVAAGGLYAALPEHLSIGPRWIVLAIVAALLLPGEVFHALGKHKYCRILGYVVISIVTLAMIGSVTLLVMDIGKRTVEPAMMLGSATILWLTNILVFAVWYWRLDAGGPHQRNMRDSHTDGAFLFPQMTIEGPIDHSNPRENWTPRFVDYLFLAFNASTALSPTDAPILSRWAKGLMMIQSTISLSIVVLLAARAVNIL